MFKALCAVVLSCVVVGCGSSDPDDAPASGAPGAPPASASSSTSPPASVQAAASKEALGGTSKSKGQTGKLVYSVETPESETLAAYAEPVMGAEIMKSSVTSFNEVFTFPKDVPVVAKSCAGEVNAFYSHGTHDITLCYELVDAIHSSLSAKLDDKTEEEQLAFTAKAMAFVMIHEVGHAFLHENGIAVLGKEEDVVDDVSGVLFVTAKKPDVPLAGTLGLTAISSSNKKFSDEHSFSEQRYFNALCLIYGSSPQQFGEVVGAEADFKLPEARAQRCPSEWTQKVTALKTIVAPFLRK